MINKKIYGEEYLIIKHLKWFAPLLFVLVFSSFANAFVEWEVYKNINLKEAPKDVEVSKNGKWIFVLTEANEILIYSPEGFIKDIIIPEYEISSITAGYTDESILLNSAAKKNVQIISFNFIEKIDTTNSPVRGEETAPIEIVVFSEFQCPYCARLVPVLSKVLEQHSGIIKIKFKHYPLKIHDMALKAAAASIVAQEQNKFWDMHDQLFEASNNLSEEKILDIAVNLGLKRSHILNAWKNQRIFKKIFKDISDGKIAGVDGVPKVFINGRPLTVRTVDGFAAMIEKEFQRISNKKEQ